jgi:hypothetical protein
MVVTKTGLAQSTCGENANDDVKYTSAFDNSSWSERKLAYPRNSIDQFSQDIMQLSPTKYVIELLSYETESTSDIRYLLMALMEEVENNRKIHACQYIVELIAQDVFHNCGTVGRANILMGIFSFEYNEVLHGVKSYFINNSGWAGISSDGSVGSNDKLNVFLKLVTDMFGIKGCLVFDFKNTIVEYLIKDQLLLWKVSDTIIDFRTLSEMLGFYKVRAGEGSFISTLVELEMFQKSLMSSLGYLRVYRGSGRLVECPQGLKLNYQSWVNLLDSHIDMRQVITDMLQKLENDPIKLILEQSAKERNGNKRHCDYLLGLNSVEVLLHPVNAAVFFELKSGML